MYPIRCFTCGKVLGNLWETWFILTEERCIVDARTKYKTTKKGRRKQDGFEIVDQKKLIKQVFDGFGIDKPMEKPHAADALGIKRRCCRTLMFTTVAYEDI